MPIPRDRSTLLGVKPKSGLAELISQQHRPEEIIVKARDGLWLLAGGGALAHVKKQMGRMDTGGEQAVTKALTALGGRYDYVILDTSPGWDVMTISVLCYAREVLDHTHTGRDR